MRCAVITGHWPPQRNTALTRAHITVTCGELWPARVTYLAGGDFVHCVEGSGRRPVP